MILLLSLALWLNTAICYLTFYQNGRQSFRRSALAASLGVFFFLAAITEILGVLNAITSMAVTGSWLVFDLFLLLHYLRLQKKHNTSFSQITKGWLSGARAFVQRAGIFTIILLSVISVATLIVAIVATPNNLDSLCYHLSRLGYWVQNKNVSHYASHIERSISFSPFSEYVHLHTFLLSGTERYFQLLQWSCLVGILAIISLLTELLSDSKWTMRIALTFAATLPIAVLESMTTQNDLVVAFFIIATAFYVFDFAKTQNRTSLIFLVLAVGLGMMTKGTFAFYALPFGLYLFIFMVSRPELYKSLVALAAGTLVILLLLNAPFWFRTYQLFGSPIGPMTNGNKTHFNGPADYISSLSKHVVLHLGFVSPGNKYNILIENQLKKLHHAMGIPLNSAGTGMDFKMNKLNFNEDFAHNFLAIWLIIFSIPLLFFARLSRPAKLYSRLALLSFLVFCFFIAYQTYGSRLHIAFFMLYSPVIGLVYSSFLSGFLSKSLVFILWLAALPFALLSVTHPLLSTKWFFETVFPPINSALNLNINIEGNMNLKQESVLFSTPEKALWGDYWPETEKFLKEVNAHHPKKIGFDFEEDSHDYAYQYSLRSPGRVFEHVAVRNLSGTLEKPDFQPDVIIAERYEGEKFSYHNKLYISLAFALDRWLYVPVP
ncbi:glycosyltransferase family 39 protein [Dyadobacter sp. CY323]|uniref:ArnT family glycosyltransferase n=1 Tax=Dyadobacter sp. CY323 TaxID=2907302 RepID=UPI001F1C9A72|nr:glycosyltransferase family 39 protein [Dyadobacter sp. CY323]MCE6993024.1 glycosyltransferase family 39 protein [Dyadobacter sp. CY323]